MPIVSKAQNRWWFANDPEKAKEMVADTPGGVKNLPERVGKKESKKTRKRLKNRWVM